MRAQTGRDLAFVQNRGQVIDDGGNVRHEVLYLAESPVASVYLRRDGITIVLHRIEADSAWISDSQPPTLGQFDPATIFNVPLAHIDRATLKGHRVDIDFVGAHAPDSIQAGDERTGLFSYYRSGGRSADGLLRYGSVRLRHVWPGIDFLVTCDGGIIKYEFIVAPGARPETIRLRYTGADEVILDGDLRIETSLGTIIDQAPIASLSSTSPNYSPLPINAAYRLLGDSNGVEIGFDVDVGSEFETPLIIDPAIIWSTYYGGSSYDFWYDYGGGYGGATAGWSGAGQGMAVDSAGNVYVAGGTVSHDFPTSVGAYSRQVRGEMDAYIVSFDPEGNRRWGTLLGGGSSDYCSGIAAGRDGIIGISGSTRSIDFPATPGAMQNVCKGDYDAFVARLDTSGRLVWSTYLGGYDWDFGGGVSITTDGGLVVGGSTQGEGLPVSTNVFQTRFAGVTDAFIARFTSEGRLSWLTYAGGSLHDFGSAVAVDRSGRVAATIRTYSHDFPTTTGGFRSGWAASPADPTEGAILLLEANGHIVWSTYFGGSDNDYIGNPAFDAAGNIYTGGSTVSLDLPTTPGAMQRRKTPGAQLDTWMARIAEDGSLAWCTYYGGSGLDAMTTIAAAPNGHVYATGYTRSLDILRADQNVQSALKGGADAFIVELDASGRLVWDSYLGGGLEDYGTGIIGDGSGSIYISGYTRSPDFPVRSPFQGSLDTSSGATDEYWDVFLSRLCGRLYPIIDVRGSTSFCEGDSVVISGPPGYARYRWMPGGDTTRRVVGRVSGSYFVNVWNDVGCDGPSETVAVTVFPAPRPRLTIVGDTALCVGDSVVLKLEPSERQFQRWSTGSIADSIVVRTAGDYSVEVTDGHGCRGLSRTIRVTMRPRPERPSIAPGPIVYVCAGETASLSVDPGTSRVRWNTGETTWGVDVTEGYYWCQVVNEAGCAAWSDTVHVIAYPSSTIAIDGPDTVFICPGGSAHLVASDGFRSYQWSTGETTRAIVADFEGTYSVHGIDPNGCVVESQMVIVVMYSMEQPMLRVEGSTTLCDGDSMALSIAPDTYRHPVWSTGETGDRIVVTRPSHVYATVETIDGCRVTTNAVDIRVTSRPEISIAGPVAVCDDAVAVYTAPRRSDYHYSWSVEGDGRFVSTPLNGPDVTVRWGRTSGRLRLHAIDTITGCDTTIVLDVESGSELRTRIALSHRTSCPDVGVILDAGGGFVSYRWSTGDSSRTITAVPGRSYWVELVSSDGCRGRSDTVVVPGGVLPNPVITAMGPLRFCDGDSVLLDAGEGYASYLWCDGSRGRFLTARAGGLYSVEVTDRSGCSGLSNTIQVAVDDQRIPVIVGPATVCSASLARYSVRPHPGSSWTWSVSGGRIVKGQSSNAIDVRWGVSGGSVSVIERSADQCAARSQRVDVVIGDSIRPRIRPGDLVPVCDGDSITLEAGPGYAGYVWSTGDTSASITVTKPGRYRLYVADSGDCPGGMHEVEVFVAPHPHPQVTAQRSTLLPRRGAIVLDADTGYVRYLWSTGARTRSIVVRDTGVYSVRVVDTNGCVGVSDWMTILDDTTSSVRRAIYITIGSAVARPGTPLTIPLSATGTDGATIGVTRITGDLRFDASMLAPIPPTPRGSLSGSMRVVPIVIERADNDTLLAAFPFIAAVGSSLVTPLELSNVSVAGSDAPVNILFGEFRLDSLCNEGGPRLIATGGDAALRFVGPNPARGHLSIEYELVEDGPARLEFVDVTGRSVDIVFDRYHRAGVYRMDHDLSGLATGVYGLLLASRRSRMSTVVVIAR